jgi:hypothetical protein
MEQLYNFNEFINKTTVKLYKYNNNIIKYIHKLITKYIHKFNIDIKQIKCQRQLKQQ